MKTLAPQLNRQPSLVERAMPLGAPQIVVGQGDPKPSVADAIHESERRDGEYRIREVILDDDRRARDAARVAEQVDGFRRMVEDIHQHHGVECAVFIRDVEAVELLDRNQRAWSHQHIDAPNVHIGPSLHDGVGDRAIAGTDIQHGRALGQDLGQMVREHANPSARPVPLVEALEDAHVRRNPSTPRK
jgi:hypothetical protein